MRFLEDMLERVMVVSLDNQEYFKVLETSSALGIAGGAIYDALHRALRAQSERADYLYLERERLRAARFDNRRTCEDSGRVNTSAALLFIIPICALFVHFGAPSDVGFCLRDLMANRARRGRLQVDGGAYGRAISCRTHSQRPRTLA